MRVATFHAELTRKGPGLLLRDIERGKDKQIQALKSLVEETAPDILLLTKVDFDLEQRTAGALRQVLGFKHAFALAPNSMEKSLYDLDGDGRSGDRQAWAKYAGEGAMLLLSRYPMDLDFHLGDILWKDIADAPMLQDARGEPYLSAQARNVLKVVTQGFWVVNVNPPDKARIKLLAFQNRSPVFDGPEDLNGLRNRAQLGLISGVLNGTYGPAPQERFVVIGNTNLDPNAGEGDRKAMRNLLADPRLQDIRPNSPMGGVTTAQWKRVGPMRVSYILPSRDWRISSSAVVWPKEGPLRKLAEQASRHRMVWLDISQPQE